VGGSWGDGLGAASTIGLRQARGAHAPAAAWPPRSVEVNSPSNCSGSVGGAGRDSSSVSMPLRLMHHQVSAADLSCWPVAQRVEARPAPAGHAWRCLQPRPQRLLPWSKRCGSRLRCWSPGHGFRNYQKRSFTVAGENCVDRRQLPSLEWPEMTVLWEGCGCPAPIRRLEPYGVFHPQAGTLSTDFFVNLSIMATVCDANLLKPADSFEGVDRTAAELRLEGSRLIWCFGPLPSCGPLAEVYAQNDGSARFVA